MVGKKGMKQSGHRIFTYKEKKFNSLGRSGLIDYFRTKADSNLIRHHFLMEYDRKLSGAEVKSLAMELNKKYWEDEKEDVTLFVETIMQFSRIFSVCNLEAYVMTLYLYKAFSGKENLTDKERIEIIDKTFKEANTLRLENWDKFMSILKEVT